MAVCDVCGKDMGFFESQHVLNFGNKAIVACDSCDDFIKQTLNPKIQKCIKEGMVETEIISTLSKSRGRVSEKILPTLVRLYCAEHMEELEKGNRFNQKQEIESLASISSIAVEKNIQGLKDSGAEGYWEYKPLRLTDKMFGGRLDMFALSNMLNAMSSEGWRLVSAYNNELGKNAIIGINETITEHIYIFERYKKF